MITYFPSVGDIKLAYQLTADYCSRFFPLISYKKLLTSVKELDEVHGEVREGGKRWSEESIQLRAFAVPAAVEQMLSRFGLEETRNCDLLVSTPDIVAAGLATQDPDTHEVVLIGRIGDHFFYHDTEYEVTSLVPASRFANTDLILYFQFSGTIYHPQSADLP